MYLACDCTKFYAQCALPLHLHTGPLVYYASFKVPCLERPKPVTLMFDGSSTAHYTAASFCALDEMSLFKDT